MWDQIIPLDRYTIIEEKCLPGKEPEYAAIPSALQERVKEVLTSEYDRIYSHQSKSIEAFLDGKDICLATSTASGKSLVFMTCATDMLVQDTLAKCLVLYPAKALIMDQLTKWQHWCSKFGLRVGHIHGDVSTDERPAVLLASRVVLMTPDVAHAWLMSHLSDNRVKRFMEKLVVVVLDEAHIYEGVFGSNMAFFMRRLSSVAPQFRLIMTTATLGAPEAFTNALTGRDVQCFNRESDGARTAPRRLALLSDIDSDTFQSKVELLRKLKGREGGRFIAFADSRRMVEQLTVAANTGGAPSDSADDEDIAEPDDDGLTEWQTILPYRAGYEDHDRNMIQNALAAGQLAGVVSTSALELGIDIGDLDLVVLFGLPPTAKSFWQRVGRVGRRKEGRCILVDSMGVVQSVHGGLEPYLSRPLEPNWLYLDNRKIQYANALCAATESEYSEVSSLDAGPFSSLPPKFLSYLTNELNPNAPLETDLLALKQRAQGGPQYEFPIRSAMELSFRITRKGLPMGSVTFSQALREAYPGAVYYYMARPYRVQQFKIKNQEILVSPTRRATTTPTTRTKVFPDFLNGTLMVMRSEGGFLAECEMQISEQVLGFKERRGAKETDFVYGLNSEFYARPITRFFPTTGVCWRFPESLCSSANVASALMLAFCTKYGVDSRDVGLGSFYAKTSPFSQEPIQGIAIFDSTDGSLRLTQRLAESFVEVLDFAISLAEGGDGTVPCSAEELQVLRSHVASLKSPSEVCAGNTGFGNEDGWCVVIADDEDAMYLSEGVGIVVRVLRYHYAPSGLKYRVKFPDSRPPCVMAAEHIQPLHGQTKFMRVNLDTGESEPLY